MLKSLSKLVLVGFILFTGSVFAADLQQAKRDGLVGERADGYLGLVVSSAPSDVKTLVAEVNAKRKIEYQRIAGTNKIEFEQVQALAGKKTIQRTLSGNWIKVNGGWEKK